MARLLVHVEGETEETFVNELLRPHLYSNGYESVGARLVGNARLRDRRGGTRAWSSVRRDILDHLKEDQSSIATTMVDYYGLPQAGSSSWPGRAEAAMLPFSEKASAVEDRLLQDVARMSGSAFDARRFIPFVMMHEFEGLLFSDCVRFARGIGQPGLAPALQAIRDQFSSPEEINDSPLTAPSKRIHALIPEYQKPLFGTLAAIEIGLDIICAQCEHFRGWIERLEAAPF
ncbi:MAG TPA: DUF4276 family protein [Blastocatellia bacterium]|nr:DUF4276 family protein [Blastocatellia bacterium]